MEYLKAVELLSEIEGKYDVMSIKYKGVSVWPHLRVFLADKMFNETNPQRISSNLRFVLKTLFVYNPLSIFKHHDIWVVCATDSRKKIGDKYIQQICGCINELDYSIMTIEKADKIRGLFRKSDILEKDIVSMSWFYMLSFALERLMRCWKIKIDNEWIIKQILNEYNISFDYKFYIRLLLAQKRITKFFLSITPSPKILFIQAPYVYMGIVWGSHEKKIPVIELQHGVINNHHYAYNSAHRYDLLMPDRICVFGDRERELFLSNENQFCKKISETGCYILEKADEFFVNDIFKEQRKIYKKIIVSAGEEGREQIMVSFLDELAVTHPDFLFVHIPRNMNTELRRINNNVEIVRGVNIYEYLKWCDIHMTVSSTTCLEAHYFRKPNIFYDAEKMGSTYYGHVLKNSNGAYYVNNKTQFDGAIKQIEEGGIVYLELYAHHPKDNINHVIKQYIA